jgi:hypothetical protein
MRSRIASSESKGMRVKGEIKSLKAAAVTKAPSIRTEPRVRTAAKREGRNDAFIRNIILAAV